LHFLYFLTIEIGLNSLPLLPHAERGNIFQYIDPCDKEGSGGILGLFESISKVHADTGNNFSVTRHQTGPQDDDRKLPGTDFRRTFSCFYFGLEHFSNFSLL
jgi:hypothetical protein